MERVVRQWLAPFAEENPYSGVITRDRFFVPDVGPRLLVLVVVDQLRAKGERVGLVKARLFRPFPTEAMRRALTGVPHVAVLDRNISPGRSGIFAEEIRSALYDLDPQQRPAIHGYIVGLGGRDVRPETIVDCIDRTREAAKNRTPEREDIWVGVNP